MKSLERVRAALSHRAPDRVPIDYTATPEATANLKRFLHIENGEALLQKLGVDIRGMDADYIGPKLKTLADGITESIWGYRQRKQSYGIGIYDEFAYHPLAGANTLEDIENHTWPDPDWWDCSTLQAKIKSIQEKGPFALKSGWKGIFEISWYMRGLEQFLEDLVVRPEFALAIMKRVSDFHMECTYRLLSVAKGKIHIIYTFDDVGTQKGPMVNPKILQELLFPLHRKHNDLIHEFGAKVIFHSCGSVFSLMDDFIVMGVDILNPLQPLAVDMDHKKIKERFGQRLCFCGGIDIQKLLPFGSVEEVRESVSHTIEILGQQGGYIMETAHAIQADAPAENIVAMYEVAKGEPILPENTK